MRFGNKGPHDHLLSAVFLCGCGAPVRVDEIECCDGLEDGCDRLKDGFIDV